MGRSGDRFLQKTGAGLSASKRIRCFLAPGCSQTRDVDTKVLTEHFDEAVQKYWHSLIILRYCYHYKRKACLLISQPRKVVYRMKTVKQARATADAIGIGLSALCLIHCLALPALLALAPAILKRLPGDDTTHRGLAVAIGLTGCLAFRSGYKVHHNRWVLGLFVLGVAIISSAAILGDTALSGYGEAAITVCGGILLVTAHILNHSFCRSCSDRDCSQTCSSSGTAWLNHALPVPAAEAKMHSLEWKQIQDNNG